MPRRDRRESPCGFAGNFARIHARLSVDRPSSSFIFGLSASMIVQNRLRRAEMMAGM
jgi:hypothetical protein